MATQTQAQQLSLFPVPPTPKPTSWKAAIRAYLKGRQAAGASAHSLAAFRRDLELLADMAQVVPANLSTQEAKRLVEQLREQASEATARRRHGTWRAFYAWQEEEGLVRNSPFRFEYDDLTPRSTAAPDFLTAQQAENLIAALSQPARFLVRLVLESGIKTSEMELVCQEDIDSEALLLRVRGKHPRAVPVTSDLIQDCQAFLRFLEEEGRQPQRPDDLLIPYSRRWMELRLQEEVEALPFSLNLTFGTLRWTRAVWDLRAGIAEQHVMAKLGYTERGWRLTRRRLRSWIPSTMEIGAGA